MPRIARSARLHAVLVGLLAMSATAACATKGYVTNRIEQRAKLIEDRVAAVDRTVDGTTEQTRTNMARIGEVDQTATRALDTATSAGRAASAAQSTGTAAAAGVDRLEAAYERLLFEVVISEDHGQFGFADATLPETATASLDALVQRLRAQPAAVHLEIEGHTDGTGPTRFNEKLGLDRAESVRRYLYEKHQLPLHKINVITYGEEKPVAPNDTVEGRAKNRRVVVRVLGSVERSTALSLTPSPRGGRSWSATRVSRSRHFLP